MIKLETVFEDRNRNTVGIVAEYRAGKAVVKIGNAAYIGIDEAENNRRKAAAIACGMGIIKKNWKGGN